MTDSTKIILFSYIKTQQYTCYLTLTAQVENYLTKPVKHMAGLFCPKIERKNKKLYFT